MSKSFILNFYDNEDYENHIHRIWNITKDDNIGGISFFAYDLTDCPEDATLTRDLFTGNEYIEALRLGMRIAQEGYTFIDVIHVDRDKYD